MAVRAESKSYSFWTMFFLTHSPIAYYFPFPQLLLPLTFILPDTFISVFMSYVPTWFCVSSSEISAYGDQKKWGPFTTDQEELKSKTEKSATEISRLKMILIRQERNNPRDGGGLLSYMNTQYVLCDHSGCQLSWHVHRHAVTGWGSHISGHCYPRSIIWTW